MNLILAKCYFYMKIIKFLLIISNFSLTGFPMLIKIVAM